MYLRALACALAVTMLIAPAYAGELDPPGAPALTMKTLDEIYNEANEADRAVGGGQAMLIYPEVFEESFVAENGGGGFDTVVLLVHTPRLQCLNGVTIGSLKGMDGETIAKLTLLEADGTRQ